MKLFRGYRSLGHWFSYNWGWVVIVSVVALMIFYVRVVQGPSLNPDYRISWVGVTSLSEEEAQAVEDAVVQAGQDVNGDGQVTVDLSQYVVDFTMSSTDAGFQDNYSYVMKLVAELQTNRCYLYLLDQPERFQFSTGALQYLDGTAAEATEEGGGYESERWEEMCVPFHAPGLERECWLARRVIYGDKTPAELFPGGDELFLALAGLN